MRPTVEDQLRGIAAVLADVVGPQLDDAYAADVLAGAVATLGLLADGLGQAAPFWRWDAEESAAVLRAAGVETPAPPADLLDDDAMGAYHEGVRALLESSIPAIRQDPEADRALVALMKERCARYPFAARYSGGTGAHTAR